MSNWFLRFFLFFSAVPVLAAIPVQAGPLKIAAASNFSRPLAELTALFQARTGIELESSISSTGRLYAQIVNGAPYDLFLAADRKRPYLLADQGFCQPSFEYARGRVVFWTWQEAVDVVTWQAAIGSETIKRLAIANPAVAPYGAAVQKVLQDGGLAPVVTPKLVYGQNVAQAYQFAKERAVDGAFIGLAVLEPQNEQDEGEGRYWEIPEAESIRQHGCILQQAHEKAAAADFVAFLKSEEAGGILARYGYR